MELRSHTGRGAARWLVALGAAGLAMPLASLAAAVQGYVAPWGWGDDPFSQNAPPAPLTNGAVGVVAVAAGYYHSLALTANGAVVAWGSDNAGQASVPSGLSGIRAIAAGGYHSVALRANGTVVAWGQSDAGQTNTGAWTSIGAIAASEFFTVGLRSNGTVLVTSSGPQPPVGLTGVSAIAAGHSHCLALKTNGTVVAWGNNSYSQTNVPNPTVLRARAIGAGAYHSLAVQSNGTVIAWGYNYYNQCNTAGLTDVIAVTGGQYHSIAVRANHSLAVWGDNSLGQRDYPSDFTNVVAASSGWNRNLALRVMPVAIASQPQGATVIAGSQATLSVTATGGAPLTYFWRKDGVVISGETNATLTLSNLQPAQSGNYSVIVSNVINTQTSSNAALIVYQLPAIVTHPLSRERLVGEGPVDFTVVATGTEPLYYQWRHNGNDLAGQTNATYRLWIVQVESAGDYTVVVRNAYGSVTSQVATLTVYQSPVITNQPVSQTVYLGAGALFRVGASNATAYQWRKFGADIPGATTPELVINPVRAEDAGDYTVLVSNARASALSATATLTVLSPPPSVTSVVTLGQQSEVWNGSEYVDVTTPPGFGNVASLSAGPYHTLALMSYGPVIGWGANSAGQAVAPPLPGTVLAVAAGGFHSLALMSDGSVIGWGANQAGQATPPPSAAGAVAIAAGLNHSLALRANGTVAGWGLNTHGQATAPPSASNNLAVIAAGAEHSVAVRRNGTVAAWGNNQYNQLLVPQTLTNPVTAGVWKIAAGSYHTLALRSNGTVVAWGLNDAGQASVPPNLSGVVAVAAGDRHSVALRANGELVGWGARGYGQLDFPAGLTGILGLAAGGNRTYLLVEKRLVLLPPTQSPSGLTLWLRNNDGTAPAEAQLARLEVHATTNLSHSPGSWTTYNSGFFITNGLIRWDDPDYALFTNRFYRAYERQ